MYSVLVYVVFIAIVTVKQLCGGWSGQITTSEHYQLFWLICSWSTLTIQKHLTEACFQVRKDNLSFTVHYAFNLSKSHDITEMFTQCRPRGYRHLWFCRRDVIHSLPQWRLKYLFSWNNIWHLRINLCHSIKREFKLSPASHFFLAILEFVDK